MPDVGRPRPPRCSPVDGGGDVRSEVNELRFRLETIEPTLPPAPPRGGREPPGRRTRPVSDEGPRESDDRFKFTGVSSL